jgi:alkylation response protein AidB-like acyl-CoA dehydrogenase
LGDIRRGRADISSIATDVTKETAMAYEGIRVQLESTGLEPKQSETEVGILAGVRRFAEKMMRPVGRKLDELHDPNQVIAPDSPLWGMLGEFQGLGLTVEAIFSLPPEERGRIMSSAFEELGWGDGGLAIVLGASTVPWIVMHMMGRHDLLERYPENRVGCWGITEPDHGSDILDFGRQTAHPGSSYGKPNCIVRVDGDELVITGQKAAWVSNGPIAQLCCLYAAFDDGSGQSQQNAKQCVVLVPLDRPGVSRGKVLDKLGQRPLPQGEIFFDEVRVPADHLLAKPGAEYAQAIYGVLTEANSIMSSVWTGAARAAYEHALDYAHTRRQGGVPIIQHQNVRYRLFHMFRKVEVARAMSRRVMFYNHTMPIGALQGSIAAKITGTQTAFEVASEAIQMFGGNGVSREYPVEKLLRDARSSMIEDGCNEMLAIKGGSFLVDPTRL